MMCNIFLSPERATLNSVRGLEKILCRLAGMLGGTSLSPERAALNSVGQRPTKQSPTTPRL